MTVINNPPEWDRHAAGNQCKDIPDLPTLEFLAGCASWATWLDPRQFAPEDPDSDRWMPCVARAMPDGTPEKLVIAKMSRLIKRGLVEGCSCGCRGDYEITERGREAVAAAHEST